MIGCNDVEKRMSYLGITPTRKVGKVRIWKVRQDWKHEVEPKCKPEQVNPRSESTPPAPSDVNDITEETGTVNSTSTGLREITKKEKRKKASSHEESKIT